RLRGILNLAFGNLCNKFRKNADFFFAEPRRPLDRRPAHFLLGCLCFTLLCYAYRRTVVLCVFHACTPKKWAPQCGTVRPCELAAALSKFRAAPALGAPQIQQSRRNFRRRLHAQSILGPTLSDIDWVARISPVVGYVGAF